MTWARSSRRSGWRRHAIGHRPDRSNNDKESFVRIGLFTDGLKHLSRRDALAWAAAEGITDVEMSVGTWGARTHLDLAALLRDERARDELRPDLDAAGIRFSAVNAAGNPLHPDPAARAEAQGALKGAIELAALLGIDRVVTMAGSPGGRTGGQIGVFGLWSISNDDEAIWSWQMETEVGPYWRALSDWMATAAPDVRVCLELHPGVSVWTLESYRALRAYCGANIGVNLDPSHFWWQGADPIRVIEALGEIGPVVGWCHGKDTTLYNEFLFALVLTSTPTAETMPVGATTLIGRINIDTGAMSAAGVIGALPIEIFSLFVQRHLVRGLTMGAVK
jgi:sugar phosphate isomerase/epimerase